MCGNTSSTKYPLFLFLILFGCILFFSFFTGIDFSEIQNEIRLQDKYTEVNENLHNSGELRLANIFDHHMVLQREPKRALLWGWCSENQTECSITVQLDSKHLFHAEILHQIRNKNTILKWIVELPPQMAGGPHTIIISDSQNIPLKINDVYFGDVYNCVGQSNMLFTVAQTFKEREKPPEQFDYQLIRIFSVGQKISNFPEDDITPELTWQKASENILYDLEREPFTYFSAVCWYYGKSLHEELGIPIGLISQSANGSPIQVCLHFI